MSRDPIVEEVRAIRDQFAARHNYDLDAIVSALKKASEDSGRQVVSLPPRPVADDERDLKAG
ncbi:MAG: hypothetical protein HY721_09925 [Planctomycetes bacterium]|nr:hypothetical protein [Planctomycetota bacterium]